MVLKIHPLHAAYESDHIIVHTVIAGRLYNSKCSLSLGAKPVNSSPIIGYYRGYIDQVSGDVIPVRSQPRRLELTLKTVLTIKTN